MKCSEFLLHVAELVENDTYDTYHLCCVLEALKDSCKGNEYKEHISKLQNTINRKLQAQSKKYNFGLEVTTISRSLTDQFGLHEYRTLRVLWLRSLAKHHAARGN